MRGVAYSVVLLLATQCVAEFRIWTGRDGEAAIEAEYVHLSGPSVFLKRPNGDSLKVPLEKLSDVDIRYVQLKNPPSLSIETDLKGLPRETKTESSSAKGIRKTKSTMVYNYQCEITIERGDKRSYSLPVKCQIYWLSSHLRPRSEWGEYDRYPREVVILKKQERVLSPEKLSSRSKKWSWTPEPAGFKYVRELASGSTGWDSVLWDRYYGYLVVLLDEENTIIEMATDKQEIKKLAPEVIAAGIGKQLLKVGFQD